MDVRRHPAGRLAACRAVHVWTAWCTPSSRMPAALYLSAASFACTATAPVRGLAENRSQETLRLWRGVVAPKHTS